MVSSSSGERYPACAAASCLFKQAKHAAKHGDFSYSVTVVNKDGTPATVDPRLIIKP